MKRKDAYVLTGPATEKPFADAGPALSCGITRAARHTEEATWYVRDRTDAVVSRVDREADGTLTVHRIEET